MRLDKVDDVPRLMNVHRVRIGHEDRGTPGAGEFGHGRGAGAADEQMRPAQPLGQVGDIGGAFGGDAKLRTFAAHLVQTLLAPLLDYSAEEQKSALQSLMRLSYAIIYLKT